MLKKITKRNKNITLPITKPSTKNNAKVSKPVVSKLNSKKTISSKQEQVKPEREVLKKVITKKEVTNPKKVISKKEGAKPKKEKKTKKIIPEKKVNPPSTAIKKSFTKPLVKGKKPRSQTHPSKKEKSATKPELKEVKKVTKKSLLKQELNVEHNKKNKENSSDTDGTAKFIASYLICAEHAEEKLNSTQLNKLKTVAHYLLKSKSELLNSLFEDFTGSIDKVAKITRAIPDEAFWEVHNFLLSNSTASLSLEPHTLKNDDTRLWCWDTLEKFFAEKSELGIQSFPHYFVEMIRQGQNFISKP